MSGLRNVITEAWDSIASSERGRLITSMPTRCQAIFEAEGGPSGLLIIFKVQILLCITVFCLFFNSAI